jgi:hypothetical protein
LTGPLTESLTARKICRRPVATKPQVKRPAPRRAWGLSTGRAQSCQHPETTLDPNIPRPRPRAARRHRRPPESVTWRQSGQPVERQRCSKHGRDRDERGSRSRGRSWLHLPGGTVPRRSTTPDGPMFAANDSVRSAAAGRGGTSRVTGARRGRPVKGLRLRLRSLRIRIHWAQSRR